MKHMPTPRAAERIEPGTLNLIKPLDLEPRQQGLHLRPRVESPRQAVRLDPPLVVHPEELPRE